VLQQEYNDPKALDPRGYAKYIKNYVQQYIEDQEATPIADGRCQLFNACG
jgi:hypothetical protein